MQQKRQFHVFSAASSKFRIKTTHFALVAGHVSISHVLDRTEMTHMPKNVTLFALQ